LAESGGMQDSDAVDRVINQVLATEADARKAIEDCREEAARIVSEAGELVRRLGHRTERRIRLIHRIADDAVGHTIRELQDSESDRVPKFPAGEATDLLDRALDALIDELIDGPP